jgi:lipid-A-disaccharide synthase
VSIKHLGIINILAGREVIPEYIQHECTPETLSAQMLHWMRDHVAREAVQKEMAATVALLGEGGAYQRAAREVLNQLT